MRDFIFRSVSRAGIQRLRRIRAETFELALEICIIKYPHIKYFKHESMDLITALERAAKASKETKKPFYVTLDDEGECSVGTAPIGAVTHKFVNGEEDKTFKPKSTSTQEKQNTNEKMIMEKKPKKVAKKAAKKTAAPKKSAPAKKPAVKKEAVKIAGEKKELTIKQIIELISKGVGVYRQTTGGKLSIVHMKAAKNKDNKLLVTVVK